MTTCTVKHKAKRTKRGRDFIAAHARVQVNEIGRVIRLDYSARGKSRTHAFTTKARLFASTDGKQLIIAPVRVARGEIQD